MSDTEISKINNKAQLILFERGKKRSDKSNYSTIELKIKFVSDENMDFRYHNLRSYSVLLQVILKIRNPNVLNAFTRPKESMFFF